jgi:hypothetical protein
MDYIDWIISSVLYVTVIALVLISLFNILPKSNNTNTISDSLYKSTISQIIPVYNVSINKEDSEIYPYVISDINFGRAENIFTINTNNNLQFGLIYDKDRFYNYETDINALSGLGVQLLSENFNDYNYQDTFDLNSGTATIKSGILELNSGTIIDSIFEPTRYLGSFLTNAEDINVYINFGDTSDIFYCSFNATGAQLFKIGEEAITENNTTPKTTNWRKLNFGYYRDFNGLSWFFCGIDNNINLIKTSSVTAPKNAKIRIEAIEDQTYIDDFMIYKSMINAIDYNGTTLKTDSLKTTITTNEDINVDFFVLPENQATEVLEYSLSFSNLGEHLNNHNEEPIKIFSNDLNQNKLVFFPMAKEFWIYKYTGENSLTINYKLADSYPSNFGSTAENWQFADLNKLSGNYAVPISFVPESSFATTDIVSFDVNFNKVFSEITPVSGSEAPTLNFCNFDICIDITNDSNFVYDIDTNTANVIFKFPEEIVTNQPFNIIINFNYFGLENLGNVVGETTSLDGTQHTARETSEDVNINASKLYLYNIFNPTYPEIKQTIIFDVFDNTGLYTQDCNFSIDYNSHNIILNCDKNYLLKVRYRFADLNNTILEYPKLNITKTNERIVTQEHFESLSCDSYFVNIKNKTLYINCGIGGNPNYKTLTKYLHNNGLLENANIYIK